MGVFLGSGLSLRRDGMQLRAHRLGFVGIAPVTPDNPTQMLSCFYVFFFENPLLSQSLCVLHRSGEVGLLFLQQHVLSMDAILPEHEFPAKDTCHEEPVHGKPTFLFHAAGVVHLFQHIALGTVNAGFVMARGAVDDGCGSGDGLTTYLAFHLCGRGEEGNSDHPELLALVRFSKGSRRTHGEEMT
jgi:hypothetical protein